MGLVILTCLIEFTLVAADYGLIGSTRWRSTAYQNGAFWAGLLNNWQPNYPVQPLSMFLSYSLLHGGPGHLAGNMVILWLLGRVMVQRLGVAQFVMLYVMSAIGGALCFGLMSDSVRPMVGASGAIFGLLGAWHYDQWASLQRKGKSLWPVIQAVLGLIFLNLVMWFLLNGFLAWQTHLGGFVAGGIVAALFSTLKSRQI